MRLYCVARKRERERREREERYKMQADVRNSCDVVHNTTPHRIMQNSPIPHWTEVDQSFGASGSGDGVKRALMLWPASKLGNGKRYVVGVVGLKDESGMYVHLQRLHIGRTCGQVVLAICIEGGRVNIDGSETVCVCADTSLLFWCALFTPNPDT